MNLGEIVIGEKEYELLKVYKRDAKAVMKYLAINHHDIYMKFIEIKIKNIENLAQKKPFTKHLYTSMCKK